MKRKKIRNPVSKNMEKFNKPSTHRDRSKYNRKRSPDITEHE